MVEVHTVGALLRMLAPTTGATRGRPIIVRTMATPAMADPTATARATVIAAILIIGTAIGAMAIEAAIGVNGRAAKATAAKANIGATFMPRPARPARTRDARTPADVPTKARDVNPIAVAPRRKATGAMTTGAMTTGAMTTDAMTTDAMTTDEAMIGAAMIEVAMIVRATIGPALIGRATTVGRMSADPTTASLSFLRSKPTTTLFCQPTSC
jgi:hypothetical protein